MTRWTLPATGLALFLGFAAFAQGDDPGYFLSWQQKKQLMGLGRIQDASGTWYDVWICPGYAPPGRYAKDHFFAAGGISANISRPTSTTCLKKAVPPASIGR
jgi:hypothetical protein